MGIAEEMRALLEAMTDEQLVEWLNMTAAEMQRRRHGRSLAMRSQIALVK